MSSKNRRRAQPLSAWCVDTDGNKPTSFVRLDRTLLTSERFRELNGAQRFTYIAMTLVSQGKQEFRFTASLAEKYGIAPNTLWRHVDALIKAGFIKRKRSGWNTREPNIYEFCLDWREHNR